MTLLTLLHKFVSLRPVNHLALNDSDFAKQPPTIISFTNSKSQTPSKTKTPYRECISDKHRRLSTSRVVHPASRGCITAYGGPLALMAETKDVPVKGSKDQVKRIVLLETAVTYATTLQYLLRIDY
ncbi:hypothetical protein QVD17_14290 [Tagetes erecta]|uniref:Uncharacterized protein n=1 Tax=Tagetes erecta TaxID=13708 RepID=A0AAD8P2K1_TARER|nr:hypothetical protein QVD17_14290 [Tagetes erecta]